MVSQNKDAKWKTAIADSTPRQTVIRGYSLPALIATSNFIQAIHLVLRGELPSAAHERMLNAILVSTIDHGIATTGALATRIVRSGGVPLPSAVAAGILSVGDSYGGAIEECARILQKNAAKNQQKDLTNIAKSVVSDYSGSKKRIPGFGHRIYTKDPRTQQLFSLAKDLNILEKHSELALEIERQLAAVREKPVCLNVDGAIAAILSDMGFDWKLGKGIFIIARTAGFVAHAYEEAIREKPVRRLEEGEYIYDGERERALPPSQDKQDKNHKRRPS